MTKNPVNSSFFPPSMCYKMRIFIHREFYIYSRIREKHRKISAIFDIRFFSFFFSFFPYMYQNEKFSSVRFKEKLAGNNQERYY